MQNKSKSCVSYVKKKAVSIVLVIYFTYVVMLVKKHQQNLCLDYKFNEQKLLLDYGWCSFVKCFINDMENGHLY